MPQLSIITINYNNLAGLQKTMQSVFSQTFADYEYIIIDGGSTDGCKEYIEPYADKISYWVSEKDKGIYNAMNKGIAKSEGEYLLFLNSGDYLLHENSLKTLFAKSFDEDIIYWDVLYNISNEKIVYPDKLSFSFFLNGTLNHQSAIIKKELFAKLGSYNETSRIVADWEFFICAIFLHNQSYRHLDIMVSQYDFADNGLSKTSTGLSQMAAERKKIISKYFSGFIDDYAETEKYRRLYNERLRTSLKVGRRFVSFIRSLRKPFFRLM
jgi:glycosyltransferase involved in cell wall biosynthesis